MARDLVGGLFSIMLGGIYLYFAAHIRASALDDAVGPAGFPKTIAVVMIGLGLILVTQSLLVRRSRQTTASTQATGEADAGAHGGQRRAVLRAGGMLLLGVLYLVLVPYAGYLVTVATLMIAVALYQGIGLSWRAALIPIAGAFILWLVFNKVLGIGLPAGRLGNPF